VTATSDPNQGADCCHRFGNIGTDLMSRSLRLSDGSSGGASMPTSVLSPQTEVGIHAMRTCRLSVANSVIAVERARRASMPPS